MTYDPEYHRAYYLENKDRRRITRADWARRNPEKVRESAKKTAAKRVANGKAAEIRKRWEAKNRDYLLWNAARQRAKKSGAAFLITRDDVVIPDVCPVLGIPLNTLERGRMQPDSPSLDKIDPAQGYVPGNIWVISWRANRMKNDATPEELRAFCVGMLRVLDGETKTVGKIIGRKDD